MASPVTNSMNVDAFKTNFDGGSRPNRYTVSGKIGGTAIVVDSTTQGLLCRATSMPAVTVGIMRVPFRGRVVKIPGDRTYEEWTCTFYDTFMESSNLYNSFWNWNREFNNHKTNIPEASFQNSGGVNLDPAGVNFQDWTVEQLNMMGTPARTVKLMSAWPSVVSEIALTYDAADTIAEFTVTFAYDWLETK